MFLCSILILLRENGVTIDVAAMKALVVSISVGPLEKIEVDRNTVLYQLVGDITVTSLETLTISERLLRAVEALMVVVPVIYVGTLLVTDE